MRRLGRGALFVIFTLSGFSGLIYESIWSHYLKLFLGHAAYAQALVLTVFMGGMALGAWLTARFSPRLRAVLGAYAWVELLTGLFALLFHPAYLGVVDATFGHIIPAFDTPSAINAAKWSIATLLILPQSILLGSTFPFISAAVVRRFPDKPGATLAMLYFTNSLGAALGVLASGFLLIGSVGLPGTVMIAGLINIALALVVWLLRGDEPASTAVAPSVAASDDGSRVLARRILLVALLSGVATFIYEIAWIRMLSMVLGSSTHAFELMLSAFILGLAAGGLFVQRRIDALADPLASLALMFCLMAGLAALTLPMYGFTFDVVAAAMRAFDATESGYVGFNLVSHAVAAAVMIPTTFVAGMTLPLLTCVLLRRAGEAAVGRVYAINTVGAILGVLFAVHLLLPSVGLKGAVIAGAAIQLGAALVLLTPRAWLSSPANVRALSAGCVMLVALIAALTQLDPMRMAAGVYRRGAARLPESTEVVYLRDGKTATIAVARDSDIVTISTNGKPDAALNMGAAGNPHADELTMSVIAALPLAMLAEPRDVANIGIGSGLTSQIVLASDKVQRLDSIEIEPVVAEAARLGYGARVSRLFEDPRSHIHFEDAKTFFSASKRRYDLILSEPSNPWVSGVATLFSEEFYGRLRQFLKPDGLLVQWIQIYETDETVVASIVAALAPHFRDYAIYCTDDSDIVIVASPEKPVPPLRHDLFATPALAAELRRAGFESMGDFELRRIGDRRMLDALMKSYRVPANSDFHPYVDLTAPRMRFLGRNALDLVRLGHLPVPLAEIFGAPLASPAADSPPSTRYFYRQELADRARGILRAVQSREASQAPEESREAVGRLLEASDCADEPARMAWLNAVHVLAARTTSFVTVSERTLWNAVNARASCIAALTESERAWLGMLEAVARGDNGQIAAHGTRLLTDPPGHLTGNQVIEALVATTAAQVAQGNPAGARELLDAWLPALQSAGQFTLALRLVDSLARSGR